MLLGAPGIATRSKDARFCSIRRIVLVLDVAIFGTLSACRKANRTCLVVVFPSCHPHVPVTG